MAALGLDGYSSSDSEGEVARVDIRDNPAKDGLANADVEAPVNLELVRATASAPVAPGSFNSFGRSKQKARHSRGGLPLFTKPIQVENASESDDDEEQQYKRMRSAAVSDGRLSFLPEPVHALPVLEEEAEEQPDLAASQPHTISCVGTSEMYRVDTGALAPVSTLPESMSLTPEALLAQSMKAGQHVEFREIKADVIQQAAPHEKTEIDAMRTAMGSEHAKQVQASAGQYMPSKRQKQRHQLNSLYHKAQMTELQDMERKLTYTRSKAQTAAKYGW